MSLGIKAWDALEGAQTHLVSCLPHTGTDRAAGKSNFSHHFEKSLLKSQPPYCCFKWLVHFQGTSWVSNGQGKIKKNCVWLFGKQKIEWKQRKWQGRGERESEEKNQMGCGQGREDGRRVGLEMGWSWTWGWT